MTTVTLFAGQAELGSIDIHGVQITQPNGSLRIPVHNAERIPLSYDCKPTFQISSAKLKQMAPRLAELLSEGRVTGNIEGYEWRVE